MKTSTYNRNTLTTLSKLVEASVGRNKSVKGMDELSKDIEWG